jgi:uncharacterized membrane protein
MSRRRRAAVLPIFAISIFGLLASVGLALDGAYAAAASRDLQSIADYSARVAADRAIVTCEVAPGELCPLDEPLAAAGLTAVTDAWGAVPSSISITSAELGFEEGDSGVVRTVVALTACHRPLLLAFAVSGAICGEGQIDLATTGRAIVGSGH